MYAYRGTLVCSPLPGTMELCPHPGEHATPPVRPQRSLPVAYLLELSASEEQMTEVPLNNRGRPGRGDAYDV